MKNNLFIKLNKMYEDVHENLTNPRNVMVRSKKSKEITMVVLRSVLLFGLCFVILFPTIQQISMALLLFREANVYLAMVLILLVNVALWLKKKYY